VKLRLKKDLFAKSLGIAASVVNARNSLPILSNLLIETSGKDEIRITGTDLEIGITTSIPAEVIEEGSITVPAKKIFDIIREIPNSDIEFQVAKNNAVHIRVSNDKGGSQFKIMGIPKDDYPKLTDHSSEKGIELPQKTLKECIALTIFAISHDETRYVLNGALFSLKEGSLSIISTDGRRLAFVKKEIGQGVENAFEVIVPRKTITELSRLLDEKGNVRVVLVKNQIVFDFGKTFIVSRLIEGHFPNYEQVIPKEETATAQISREDFLQAVKRASLLTSQDSQAVKLEFMKDKLAISSRSPNLGEAREEFPVEFKGDDTVIGFNPNYLTDVLRSLDAESVLVSLSGSDRPGVIKGENGYLYVIMPMQLTT